MGGARRVLFSAHLFCPQGIGQEKQQVQVNDLIQLLSSLCQLIAAVLAMYIAWRQLHRPPL